MFGSLYCFPTLKRHKETCILHHKLEHKHFLRKKKKKTLSKVMMLEQAVNTSLFIMSLVFSFTSHVILIFFVLYIYPSYLFHHGQSFLFDLSIILAIRCQNSPSW